MFTVPTSTLVINEPPSSPVIPILTLPTSLTFKEAFNIAITIQVNTSENSEYYGNVEVYTTNGNVYVFMGNGITPGTLSIAYGPDLDDGPGWMNVPRHTVLTACGYILSVL